MKRNLFYYSEQKLKYIEIKNFYPKFIGLVAVFSVIFAFLFVSSFVVIKNILYPESNVFALYEENKVLKEKFIEMSGQISQLNSDLEALNLKDEELRLSVNLSPRTKEEKNIGIGGNKFNELDAATVSSIGDMISNFDYSLDLIKSKVTLAKENYLNIEEARDKNLELFKCIPALLPANGRIGDKFGMRMHPILRIKRLHSGIDILVNTGHDVFAPGNGKVIRAGWRGGYGKTVEIDHGFGYTTLYAHLSKILVKKGQKVKRGEILGKSGKSGRLATGPHLHYEVKHNGVLLNPSNFIFSDIKVFDLLTEKEPNK